MRLIKDMYRENLMQAGLFGLLKDQMRAAVTVQNAGWYNQRGEYLGHGDLGLDDLARIAQGIADDEAFVIFQEDDWRHESSVARKGGPSGKEFYKELGADYAAKHCAAIVTPYGVFVPKRGEDDAFDCGKRVIAYHVPRKHVAAILSAFQD